MTAERFKTSFTGGNPEERKKMLKLILIIFFIFALLYSIYWLFFKQFQVYTDDAYVDGNLVQLMPQVSGIVSTIIADDTQLVLQGQPVVRLDDTDAKNDLQNAEAMLASTVREVRQYYPQAKQLAANLELRKADLVQAKNDFERRENLKDTAAISAEELQSFKTKAKAAQAEQDQALYQLEAAKALIQGTNLGQHPKVLEAAAKVQTAYLNWRRTTIVAPITGYIAKRSVQLGQQVTPGTPLLTIIPLNQIWVNANFKEPQLADIRIGQPATLTVDLYGSSVKFRGKVLGIASGTGSVFSLLPPQNATGNWIKVVQRLAVRIGLDAKQLQQHPLRIGLSGEVTVDVRNQKGNVLATIPAQCPLYKTCVYQDLLTPAKLLIIKIIHDNAL